MLAKTRRYSPIARLCACNSLRSGWREATSATPPPSGNVRSDSAEASESERNVQKPAAFSGQVAFFPLLLGTKRSDSEEPVHGGNYAMTTTARASCQGIRLTLNLVALTIQLNLIVSTRPRAELKGSKPARSDSSGPLSTERYCEQYASERARRWQINLESIRGDFYHFVNPTVT